LSNNNMLTLTATGDSLFTDVSGLPDEEFLFLGEDRFGSTDRNVSFRAARTASGEIVGLHWSAGGQERLIPRIGPLFASITPGADPDPSFSQAVEKAVRALGPGAPASELPQLAPGARANFAGRPIRELAGVRRLTYLSAQDLTGRRIERHGGTVARVLFYRMETTEGDRWLLIHVTSDNLITDYDVVDK
jgi:hypothetical protein